MCLKKLFFSRFFTQKFNLNIFVYQSVFVMSCEEEVLTTTCVTMIHLGFLTTKITVYCVTVFLGTTVEIL